MSFLRYYTTKILASKNARSNDNTRIKAPATSLYQALLVWAKAHSSSAPEPSEFVDIMRELRLPTGNGRVTYFNRGVSRRHFEWEGTFVY